MSEFEVGNQVPRGSMSWSNTCLRAGCKNEVPERIAWCPPCLDKLQSP